MHFQGPTKSWQHVKCEHTGWGQRVLSGQALNPRRNNKVGPPKIKHPATDSLVYLKILTTINKSVKYNSSPYQLLDKICNLNR